MKLIPQIIYLCSTFLLIPIITSCSKSTNTKSSATKEVKKSQEEQEKEWDQEALQYTVASAEWYRFLARKSEAQATWHEIDSDLYTMHKNFQKEYEQAAIDAEKKNKQEMLWDQEEAQYTVASAEWYRFLARKSEAQATWYEIDSDLYNMHKNYQKEYEQAALDVERQELLLKELERQEEARKRQEEADRRHLEAEECKRQDEEADRKRKDEEDERKRQDEEADRKRQEEDDQRRREEEADRKRKDDERKRQEDARKRQEERDKANAPRQTPGPNAIAVARNAGILGLPTSIDQLNWATVKKAYRTMAFKWHPDKNSGDLNAAEEFKKVSNAYQYFENLHQNKQLKD
jgi:hypothetical protein